MHGVVAQLSLVGALGLVEDEEVRAHVAQERSALRASAVARRRSRLGLWT
jgi:antitoxin component of MazEF toxin-antitoxin module